LPVLPRSLQKPESANDVGLDEVLGAVDGAVHMALGCEMHDGAGPMLGQQAVEQRDVGDVAVHEDVARVALQAVQVVQIARVGELVESDDAFVRLREPVEDEVGADEAGAAGDEDHEAGLGAGKRRLSPCAFPHTIAGRHQGEAKRRAAISSRPSKIRFSTSSNGRVMLGIIFQPAPPVMTQAGSCPVRAFRCCQMRSTAPAMA